MIKMVNIWTALLLVSLAAFQAVAQEGGQKADVLFGKLEATITQVDRELNGVMGAAILDITSGRQILRNADEVFPTASTIKIAVLAELYHQSQQAASGVAGKARLTDTYTMNQSDLVDDSQIMAGLTPGVTRVTNRDLATFMVAVSDNSATNVLIDRLGIENVNALLENLGLRQTRLRRKMMDITAAREGRENTATPLELVRLLEAVYRAKVFDKATTDDCLKVLSTRKESPIPRLIPEDVVIANKPGALEGVRCDAGIVFAKDRPFVISVMTGYDVDEPAADAAISRIALAAYECFERLGRSSPYGRVVSPRNSR
jgi:beta-lactamase class A